MVEIITHTSGNGSLNLEFVFDILKVPGEWITWSFVSSFRRQNLGQARCKNSEDSKEFQTRRSDGKMTVMKYCGRQIAVSHLIFHVKLLLIYYKSYKCDSILMILKI